MSRSKKGINGLARLLNMAAAPVYALDDERRIIFVNDACSQWLGLPAEELLGLPCPYQVPGLDDGSGSLASGLCPPPEAFSGQRTSASVFWQCPQGELAERQAEFIPLSQDGECLAVLAFLSPQNLERGAPQLGPPEPTAAELHNRLARLRSELRGRFQPHRLIGDSPAMTLVRGQVDLAITARSSVLIAGPRGSGRSFVAKTIHHSQQGDPAPLHPVSCALLGSELLRSTLAALDAKHSPRHQAGVALLLRDVDQVPPEVQADLLSLATARSPKLRLLATSREPLLDAAARGEYLLDLAYVLSTLVIQLPPLAQRAQDIPLLAQMFLEEVNGEGGKQLRGFAPEALDRLAAYDWPGNLAELSCIVRQAHARAAGCEVTALDLPEQISLAADAERRPRRSEEPIVLERFLAGVETELIRRALKRARGNKSKAAKLLGMTRPRLYRRMVQLGLAEGPTPRPSAADVESP